MAAQLVSSHETHETPATTDKPLHDFIHHHSTNRTLVTSHSHSQTFSTGPFEKLLNRAAPLLSSNFLTLDSGFALYALCPAPPCHPVPGDLIGFSVISRN